MKENITKELQKIELNIFKDFIKVCDKLNINYYLIGGTLLGAIRHNGFIPWDDDIDVCMLRDDYEVFIKYGQEYLDKNYFLQTYETDSEYPGCYAKIRDNNTTFLEDSVKTKKMNHGIFIDIFPLDDYHKHNKVKEKLIYYKLYNEKFIHDKNFKKRLVAKLAKILYGNKTKLELCKMQEMIYTRKSNSNYVTNYCGAWGVEKETHNKKCFEDFKIVKFENLDVKVPIGYDEMLKKTYGDYMQLPPKEKRVSHHNTEIIDTKKSYKEYVISNEEKK